MFANRRSEKQNEELDHERAYGFLFGLLLPPEKPDFAESLTQLAEVRGTVLADKEYFECRQEIFDELAGENRRSSWMVTLLGLFGVAALGISYYGHVERENTLVWAGFLIALYFAYLAWRALRHGKASARLTMGQRLAILDELLAAELVSSEEAGELRGRIENWSVIRR